MVSGRSKQVLRVSLLLCAFYALLAARLYHVQVTESDHFGEVQDNLQTRPGYKGGSSQFERPERGTIFDRNGIRLAVGFDTYRLLLDMKPAHRPRSGQKELSMAQRLGLLSETLVELGVKHDRLDMIEKADNGFRTRTNAAGEKVSVPKRGITLLKGVLPWQRDRIRAAMRRARVENFGFIPEASREYPYGALLAEVVGFVGQSKATPGEVAGRAGIEGSLEHFLSATPGKYTCEKDGLGREIDLNATWVEEPVPSWDVELTLDVEIQKIAWEALEKACKKAKCPSGCAIVLDSNTGEILAMKSYPEMSLEAVRAGKLEPGDFRCVGVMSRFEPGSTIKPIIMAMAIAGGFVAWDDTFDTNNGFRVFKGPFNTRGLHDSHHYQVLTAAEVLIKSSNIGMAMIGWERMGYQKLMDGLEAWKMGRKLKLRFPGVVKPRLPDRAKRNPLGPGVSVPFGHEIAMTPLGLLAYINVFATGGFYFSPKFVRAVKQGDRRVENRTEPERVVREDVADQVLDVMERTTEEGTGKSVSGLAWYVASKTGTAQRWEGVRAFNSSMVAIAPVSSPRISVYVGLYDVRIQAATGGQTAGPAVAEIIDRTLRLMRVPPEREPKEKTR